MKKNLYKYVLAISLVLLAPLVSALEIEVNGKVVKSVSYSELQEIARQRPLSGGLKASVVLDALLTICSSLKEITVAPQDRLTHSRRSYGEVLPLYQSY